MASQDKETRIPLNQVEEILERTIGEHDLQRADGLDSLGTLRRVKAVQLAREQARLSRKLGADAPRVREAADKLEASRALVSVLKFEADRARTEMPVVDDHTWVLHGHVLDKELAGVPNLTVALYDARGKWVEELGHACTDRTGYFKLTYGRDRKDAAEGKSSIAAGGPSLFAHVLDKNAKPVHVDGRPITPEAGRVDYLEIVLGEEPVDCAPPKPAKRPPTEPPRQRDPQSKS